MTARSIHKIILQLFDLCTGGSLWQKNFMLLKMVRLPEFLKRGTNVRKALTAIPAVFKSFKTKDEALAFLGIESSSNSGIPIDVDGNIASDSSCATAYVDGSYNIATKEFGYGVVMFHNGEELHMSKSFSDAEMASMRNVAGEIFGSMAAMEYAVNHGITNLSIYYDYMGISKWCTGEWKANKKGTIAYRDYYNKIKTKVNVQFEKVKGHSGDKYNDMADMLAKKACGVL